MESESEWKNKYRKDHTILLLEYCYCGDGTTVQLKQSVSQSRRASLAILSNAHEIKSI